MDLAAKVLCGFGCGGRARVGPDTNWMTFSAISVVEFEIC